MIDLNALVIAIRTRLKADGTLTTLIGDVYRGAIPALASWAKPNLEIGIQADTNNQDTSYGTVTQDLLIRVMAHDKGPAPGVGSFADCYAALVQADSVLLASPLVVGGMTITDFRRDSGIPEQMPPDSGAFPRFQVGSLYRARIDE